MRVERENQSRLSGKKKRKEKKRLNSFVLTRTCKNRECLLYNMPHILFSFTALWDLSVLKQWMAGHPGPWCCLSEDIGGVNQGN